MEKELYPEDVEIIVETKTMYRAKGGRCAYDDERIARHDGSTRSHCATPGCENPADKQHLYCSACAEKRHVALLAEAPIWDGAYPIFIGDMERFCLEEDCVLGILRRNGISTLSYVYSAKPIYAKDAITRDAIEEIMSDAFGLEDDCFNGAVEDAISDFLAKIEAIREPQSYLPDNLVRLSDEQIAHFTEMVEGNEKC